MTSTAGQQDAAVGDVVDPVVSPKDTPILNDDNKFKLVLLSLNTGRGTTLSHGAGTLRITWDETVRIAQAAERAGIDAILPIAHWKNWTRSRPQYDRNWDALTFAAGLAAVTERIQFFSTVHIPLFHPVMVAKMAATVDHIASGRLALNVVAGWNQAEFGMFGLDPVEHDERYEYAAEWMDLLQRIFREDAWFDFEGRYLRGRDIASQPKPLQRPSPVIMSAGSSPVGLAFAARYADVNFGIYPNLDDFPEAVRRNRQIAAEAGNPGLKFCGHAYVVCADTEKEARRRYEYLLDDELDRASTEALMTMSTGKMQSIDVVAQTAMMRRTAGGNWGFPLIGTAEQVAEDLMAMAKGGLEGTALSFPDYDEGVARYDESIRPLLVEAGLRKA
ncbi:MULTISPECIES: LLM class flavin-dependent oxidoreductase [Actinomadura]|uniref:Flavin-dependent oxidoreductase, luciferase family (Includes alkanesulfonate monooxygenase SsuD and methylene tetrahydromethanopterin reductase) n=1 Tax=Actinomadura madurae TaxID=1993 RepID=A0A1I5M3Z6_9ACTN|nr:LLM class flavin-dependent oxidoreductase [Actinomadura madurae]SFP04235.1 Flavin-dependent oxidoreductase, luciferase family (includes alkanesulfonate monooxygenase SsuD and methylene tetrahydromethanopterin reductase) [Actinomadura madurae]SPT52314.1 Pyrimidine monooxygenase RutA [Actinomadura madurae]